MKKNKPVHSTFEKNCFWFPKLFFPRGLIVFHETQYLD